MNKVILTGNLCRDISIAETPSGKEVVQNCLAVRREYKNANGEYDSDFINIVAWGAQAKYLNTYGKKGDRVEVVGRWEVGKYTDSDGTQRVTNKCVVENISVFSSKPKEEQQTTLQEYTDGDLPF